MLTIEPASLATRDLHQYIIGAIAPRPIAFVSTLDKEGHANLAPYSFFNAFSSNPPMLIFSSNRRVRNNTTKDTLANVEETGEVVINVVNYAIVYQMSLASVEYPADISEFEKTGLTPIASEKVAPFRVKESPVQFECKVKDIIKLGEHGGAGNLILCEAVLIHVNENILDEKGRIDPHKADLMGRLGKSYYVRASGEALFSIPQEVDLMSMGVDKLPAAVRLSKVLTGNDLARLASEVVLPTAEEVASFRSEERIQQILAHANKEEMKHTYAQELINKNEISTAWKVLLSE